jgi:acetyltransferase-like isoleucine patch superfamily enzyme
MVAYKKFFKPLVMFGIYVFNILMYIPFYRIRWIFIKLLAKRMGKNNFVSMGIKYLGNPFRLTIGNNCVINRGISFDVRGGEIIIGNYVDLAQETNIWTMEHDPHDDFHSTKGGNVIIEDYVWIASRVTILPNITIGKGAVVACNSVVTKDVPPMAIVAGVPAKVIGIRRSKLLYKFGDYKPWFT